ncbi:DNA pilot protein [Blackfly microvirus SF02]|uniref:DNA pilot protein n=1 Tax=Blackfly microvirus SF02 TaxID=2576452 RepID=A0A4P8PSL7_9VIRU|nr:DNA pilot protein [Blackfly microvirus SF02]
MAAGGPTPNTPASPGSPGGAGPFWQQPWFANILDVAGQAYQNYQGSQNVNQANKTNINLQQQQQQWEADMSNTAVQRRKADIIAAGGNPALAFTNGSEATTPAVSQAQVQPFHPDFRTNFTASAIAQAQLRLIQAQTMQTTAQARATTVSANIAEATAGARQQYELNHFVENYEWDDIRTQILRSQDVSTAAQAKVAQDSTDAVIANLKQQAATGKINLDQLQSLVNTFGLGAQAKADLMRTIGTLILQIAK